MRNKKGILRIVEAVLAILIILTAVLILRVRTVQTSEENYNERLGPLLDELAKNVSLRQDILESKEGIDLQIKQRILEGLNVPGLDGAVSICGLEGPCAMGNYPLNVNSEIYSVDRVISANLNQENYFAPKRIKVFLWKSV